MAIELRQQLKLTQQLIMTPQLQMAIKLLQLSRLELIDVIRQEMEENPALDESPEAETDEEVFEQAPPVEEQSSPEKEVTVEEKIPEDIDWSNYIDEYNTPGSSNFESEFKETPKYESFIAQKESLSDHLLWQLLMTSPSEEEVNIGSLIIGNLNKDGYLEVSLDELVHTSNASFDKVQNVLSVLQTFDPIGICARNLSECLLIQAEHFGLSDPVMVAIIKNHLNHLENKNYKAICRSLKISLKEVLAAVDFIQGLEPKPGRLFSDEEPQYINPDIFVYKTENDFVIVLNDDGIPRLRISAFYRNSILRGDVISNQTKEYIQEKLRSAAWLIRSIHQRQKTIYKVMESILKFQKEFFEKGVIYLKPMVLKDVAQDIGMHESTISRVTTNKYAFTPQGIFELKYFFNSSINRIHGESVSSASVQEKIRQLVENEDGKQPYSDCQIAEILKEDNIDIARRTIAKYREMMKLLPSNKRKKI
ncbi:MAG: RNA polymerase factor sigma-54 [Desulfobacterales bacterium]|nr:RNA polymerase factor sigma-54 [Desulfobacterales bacterium]